MRIISIVSVFVSFSALVVAFSLQCQAYIQVLLGLITVGCIEWELICGRKVDALSGDPATSGESEL